MTNEEQERIAVQDVIDESGCQIMQIMGDNYMPPFAYTIGLHQQFNHPEIICFGLSLDVMLTLLNNAKDRIEDEEIIEPGKTYKGFLEHNVDVSFIEVNQAYYKDYFGYGTWFYGNNDFPVLQLVWPDKRENFPWDENFDKKIEFAQPLLDRNMDFRFMESKNLGVFTTTQVLNGKAIKYVIHDSEGDWFFLESADDDTEDMQIIGLEQLVKLEPSINSIYHLQYGWEAHRESVADDWDELEMDEEDEE